MSSLIPMVSSSPPPMDDGWEGGEDFGDFASADFVTSHSSFSMNASLPVTVAEANNTQNNWSETEEQSQSPLVKGKAENCIGDNHGFKESLSEDQAKGGDNWADFQNCLPEETNNTCNCSFQTCECNSNSGQEQNGVHSNTDSDHLCSDSTRHLVSPSVQDKCDTISQGSLTDSGMYSNNISPAPNTGDSLCFGGQFNCDHKGKDSGGSECTNEGDKLSPSHSLASSGDMCSSDTSQTNGGVVKEDCVSDAEDVVQSVVCVKQNGEQNHVLDHGQHEESPEPLDFKPASFSEEEGQYFETRDFDDGFSRFYEDKDFVEDSADGSQKDTDEVHTCDKQANSSSGDERDTSDKVSNTSLEGCDESDNKSDSTVELNTFHEHSSNTNIIPSEAFRKSELTGLPAGSLRSGNSETGPDIECTNNTKDNKCSTRENSSLSNMSSAECNTNQTEINQSDIGAVNLNHTDSQDILKEDTNLEITLDNSGESSTDGIKPSDCEISNNKELSCREDEVGVTDESPTACNQNNMCDPDNGETYEHADLKENASDTNSVKDEEDRNSFGEDSEDFEFADFASAEVKPANDDAGWCSFGATTIVEEDQDYDWAAFSEPSAPRFELKDDDNGSEDIPLAKEQEDEFGTFEGPSTEDDFGDFSVKREQVSSTVSSQNSVSTTLTRCFPKLQVDSNGNPQEEYVDQHMLERVAEEKVKYRVTEGTRRDEQYSESEVDVDMNLWNYLKDMENARGIKFSWSNSNAMNMLLKAVNVDSYTMEAKKPSMPVFASGLGVVLKPRSMADTYSSRQMRESTDQTRAIIVDMDKPSQTTSGNSSQELPAVDFDWKTSGLTNPLDAHSTVPLDLDFFVANDKGSSGISKAQQNEQAILQSLEPLNRPPKKKKIVQPLEHILANMKFIPTVLSNALKTPEEKKLSAGASQIVDGLKDFSFMKAQVLMFPVAGDGGSKAEIGETQEEVGENKSDIWDSKGEIGGNKSDIWDSKGEARDSKAEEGDSKAEVGDTKGEIWDSKADTGDSKDWLAEAEEEEHDGVVNEMF